MYTSYPFAHSTSRRPSARLRHVDDISRALAEAPLFAALDESAVSEIAATAEVRTARAGDVIMREGEAADAFYLVRSGVFEVVAGDARTRLLRAGALFGELALLAGVARTATVRALRDGEVLRFPGTTFEKLMETDPGFARVLVAALTRLVFESTSFRSQDGDAPAVVAIAGLDVDAPVDALVARFAGERTRVLGPAPSGSAADWGATIEAHERAGDDVLLVAPAAQDEWFSFCTRVADRIALCMSASRCRDAVPLHTRSSPELVVFGPVASSDLSCALDALRPRAHHLVNSAHDVAALDRTVRRVQGRSLGIVFSGGGARGIAHIGVLAALADAGYVVDRYGGTSMGALIGALAATGTPPSVIAARMRAELVDRKPFADYGLPRVSLIRARRARSMLERLLGARTIEAMPHDYFCVSADLASAAKVVHRRGSLVVAVGASMSLPGLAPPVLDEGRLLVDGGVLDNLPIATMCEASEGPVVGVDVLARGMRTDGRMPSLLETVARSTTLASRQRAEEQRALAAFVVTPELTRIGLLDFNRFDEIVEAGRRAGAELCTRVGVAQN